MATVKDLIAQLSKLPGNADVIAMVHDDDWNCYESDLDDVFFEAEPGEDDVVVLRVSLGERMDDDEEFLSLCPACAETKCARCGGTLSVDSTFE